MTYLFRSKPSEIEAVQYGPEFRPGLVHEIAEFIAGRELADHEMLDYVQPYGPWDPPDPESSVIQILAGADGAQGWVPVPLGHWIVRSVGGRSHHWPVDPDYFTNKYEEVPDERTREPSL